MKKHYIRQVGRVGTVLLFSLTLLFASCTDLKDESFDNIIASQFSPDESDLAALKGAAYVNWREVMLQWNGLHRANEVTADQAVIPARPNGWVDGGVYRRLHEHKWTTDDDVVINTWNRTYAGITNCNRIIYQVEEKIIPVPEEEIESLIAEIKLLRASYYWVLIDFFGNVPIIERFDVPEGFLPEQNTRTEVFDFIVEEVKNNIQKVSPENNQTTYGKFNKWAGFTLLAKMYLNAEVYTGESMWEECISACDSVINSGAGYELESNQKNVFITDNQNSAEIIFALPFESKYVTAWNAFDIHMQTLQPANQKTYNLEYSPWGGICAVPQFIETFDPDDSRYLDNYIKGQQYASNGDSLYCTLGELAGEPLAYINELPGVDDSQEIHGFRLGKFEIEMGATNRLSNDWPLFRYADILLMKAESLLRLGFEDEAATIVTQVRSRNFPGQPEKAEVTGADLLQGSAYEYGLDNHLNSTYEGGADIQYGAFLDILGREFCQEGRRRSDMIRFGAFTTKSWLSHSPNGDHRVLFPIPEPELQKNPNLTQNPGY
jgi:hypothetical protein